MRILLLQDADWQKKGPHQQHHLMELMSKRGHEIMIIGFGQLWREEKFSIISKKIDNNSVNRFYSGASIHYIRPSFIKIPIIDYISFTLISFFEIRKQINKFQPDVIIGFSSVISNYWGALLASRDKIPYIYYWYDIVHVLNIPKPFGPAAKSIEKKIIKRSNLILTMNEGLKDSLLNLGAAPHLIHVVPGGIDFERFDLSKVKPLEVREKLGLSTDDTVLFFMGWLYEFSGLKEVILDIARVKQKYPKLKLLIVGEGDYYLELKDIVKKCNIADHVILTGKRPYEEIPSLISAADLCLLPAYNNEIMRDIVPIKMYEYLAMHKPVIATKLPGISKEFGEDNGVLYVENSIQVIEKVIHLSKSEIYINQESAKLFIENYKWDAIISHFEKILETIR